MRRGIAAGTMTLTLIFAVGGSAGIAAASPERAVCPGPAAAGSTRCFAHVVTDSHGTPATSSLPKGYGPAQFHGAYTLPTEATGSQTIAIVDAYDDPSVRNDLTTYDNTYGLKEFPTCSSSSASSCFLKVNQNGATSPLPSKNAGWALEIALDVETAHEICQNCKIVLVEANTNSIPNLDAAEDTAFKLGATEISNSWGTESEYSGEVEQNTHFNRKSVAITVASGDNGYNKFGFPAASKTVIAAGGTTLKLTSSNGWESETAWKGSGSGCSIDFAAPAWQNKTLLGWSATGCGSQRGVADVAADADPNTGAAVYDTTKYFGQAGWFQVGGTSLASPLIAGVYALAGNAGTVEYPATLPYGNVSSYGYTSSLSALHDVTVGSTGSCGTTACNAGPGYDGPTGVGTPKGIGGF
jgi:subtilase family serine protease